MSLLNKKDQTGWNLDRRLSLSGLFALLTALVSAVTMVVTLQGRVEQVEQAVCTVSAKLEGTQKTHVQVQRLEERMVAVQGVLEDIRLDVRELRQQRLVDYPAGRDQLAGSPDTLCSSINFANSFGGMQTSLNAASVRLFPCDYAGQLTQSHHTAVHTRVTVAGEQKVNGRPEAEMLNGALHTSMTQPKSALGRENTGHNENVLSYHPALHGRSRSFAAHQENIHDAK